MKSPSSMKKAQINSHFSHRNNISMPKVLIQKPSGTQFQWDLHSLGHVAEAEGLPNPLNLKTLSTALVQRGALVLISFISLIMVVEQKKQKLRHKLVHFWGSHFKATSQQL